MKIVNVEKKLVDKLVEECSENIDGNELISNDNRSVCNSCIIYIVLLVIFFIISVALIVLLFISNGN